MVPMNRKKTPAIVSILIRILDCRYVKFDLIHCIGCVD